MLLCPGTGEMSRLIRFRSWLPYSMYCGQERVLDDIDRQGTIRDWEGLPVLAERPGM